MMLSNERGRGKNVLISILTNSSSLWESLLAPCWRWTHYYGNWCRCTGCWRYWTKGSDFITSKITMWTVGPTLKNEQQMALGAVYHPALHLLIIVTCQSLRHSDPTVRRVRTRAWAAAHTLLIDFWNTTKLVNINPEKNHPKLRPVVVCRKTKNTLH